MKIYTKTGDKGETGLFGGARVPKSHVRIEAYGTVDELNSWMGLLRDFAASKELRKLIIEIQDRLFTIGSILASDPGKKNLKLPPLNQADIEVLEKEIDQMDKDLPPMRTFVLPGGNEQVSHCHIARCICRRAERRVIALNQIETVDSITYTYLNRLSDFLFVLSRKIALDTKAEEIPWNPKF